MEDQILIEILIFPRLFKVKLSEVKLGRQETAKVAKEVDKGDTSVVQRWHS